MPAKPMLDDVELQQVQKVESEDQEVLAHHGVPALEGDFLQDLGRRVTRLSLNGVMTGPEAGDKLKTLREKFRSATPVPFVADIATATKVDKVLIEELGLRELAGKPERFEYELTLREFLPPPRPEQEEPPPPPPQPPLPDVETGTLIVEVTVEGQPNFDFSKVTVTAEGTKDDGSTLSQTLTNRAENVWTEENLALGQFTVRAVVTDPPAMSNSAAAAVLAGATTKVGITLRPGAIIATAFVVHFRFDNAFLEPCMREVLKQVAGFADANKDAKLLITGNTDEVGSPGKLTDPDPYNQSLSERRARGVFSYLTFGTDATAATKDWNALRQKQGALPTLGDKWGARQYQYMLQALSFYPGVVDGDHGPLTDDAVQTFRQAKGLPPGTVVDDAVWNALIEDYLKQDTRKVPGAFLPNVGDACDSGIIKWLGLATQDPVKNVRPAFRPNRRVELLFVKVAKFPCQEPQPDTFNLPALGDVNADWCLKPGNKSNRTCFVVKHLPAGGKPKKDEWTRQPAEPGSIKVSGSIKFEDGTPAGNVKYILIAPDGEFMDGEKSNGEGVAGKTKAKGTFEYANQKGIGIYTLEIQDQLIARLEGEPQSVAKGAVVCKRLDGSSPFNVVVRKLATIVNPIINLASAVVVVKKSYTNPARQAVTLGTDGPFFRSGTFSRAGAAIRFFDAAVAGNEITFDGTDNVFQGSQLSAGVQLFAEAASVSTALDDVQLTLTLTPGATPVGPPATAAMTAVELTLDIAQTRTSANVAPPLLSDADKIDPGRVLIVQDATFSHERAMLIVHPSNPNIPLTLRLAGIGSVQAFTTEIPASGQVPIANPTLIPSATLPPAGAQFFAEGKAPPSTALRDARFTLGVDGVENDADHVIITVFPDPSLPGPFAVGEHEYTRAAPFSVPATIESIYELTQVDIGLPATVSAGSFPAAIKALVRYPAESAGVDKPVSSVLPKYPLVIIAHGNHRTFISPGVRVESFRGLEYLARHLASYGYIAVSIDLEDMNVPVSRLAIVQRGLTILEHLDFWGTSLNVSDPLFTGKVDSARIGLIGHSRGAEAVVSAQKSNIDDSRGFAISAITSIAPTDFLGVVHTTTPYLVIYGSADGDVSIGWPFRLYDRAVGLKSMIFVYGAIHNRFSTSPDWLSPLDSSDGRMMSAPDHLNIAKGYCLGFLQLLFRGVGDHVSLFKKNGRPSTVSAGVEIHHQVQDNPPRLTVDNFEQGSFNPANPHGPQLAARAATNTLGQAVSQSSLAIPLGLTSALTEASLRNRDLSFFRSDTFGAMLAWDSAGGSYRQPLGSQDVSSFEVLSFRVTQRFGSPRNPAPPGTSPDFSVALVDSAARTASVRVGTIAAVPVPYQRFDDPSLTTSAPTTIRIPLSAFTAVNASLDLTSLQAVVVQFLQTARGEIAIDDLEFSN